MFRTPCCLIHAAVARSAAVRTLDTIAIASMLVADFLRLQRVQILAIVRANVQRVHQSY